MNAIQQQLGETMKAVHRLLAVTALMAGVALSSVPGASADTFAITLDPSTGLANGQTVTASFTGAVAQDPGGFVYFDQCGAVPTSSAQQNCGTPFGGHVTPAADGSGSTQGHVDASYCQQTYTGCYIIAFYQPGDGTNAYMVGNAAIAFAPPNIAVPPGTYADGQPISFTVSGFDPYQGAAQVSSYMSALAYGNGPSSPCATNTQGGGTCKVAAYYGAATSHGVTVDHYINATGYAPGQGQSSARSGKVTVVAAATPVRVPSASVRLGSGNIIMTWKPITQAQEFAGYVV
jgi:hypothetical protein